jgi:hypothetical protein
MPPISRIHPLQVWLNDRRRRVDTVRGGKKSTRRKARLRVPEDNRMASRLRLEDLD